MSNAASVKARLRNRSIETGKTRKSLTFAERHCTRVMLALFFFMSGQSSITLIFQEDFFGGSLLIYFSFVIPLWYNIIQTLDRIII